MSDILEGRILQTKLEHDMAARIAFLESKSRLVPNYKYKSFEDLRNYLVESPITCAIDLEYAFNAARELTGE